MFKSLRENREHFQPPLPSLSGNRLTKKNGIGTRDEKRWILRQVLIQINQHYLTEMQMLSQMKCAVRKKLI